MGKKAELKLKIESLEHQLKLQKSVRVMATDSVKQAADLRALLLRFIPFDSVFQIRQKVEANGFFTADFRKIIYKELGAIGPKIDTITPPRHNLYGAIRRVLLKIGRPAAYKVLKSCEGDDTQYAIIEILKKELSSIYYDDWQSVEIVGAGVSSSEYKTAIEYLLSEIPNKQLSEFMTVCREDDTPPQVLRILENAVDSHFAEIAGGSEAEKEMANQSLLVSLEWMTDDEEKEMAKEKEETATTEKPKFAEYTMEQMMALEPQRKRWWGYFQEITYGQFKKIKPVGSFELYDFEFALNEIWGGYRVTCGLSGFAKSYETLGFPGAKKSLKEDIDKMGLSVFKELLLKNINHKGLSPRYIKKDEANTKPF